MVFDNENLLLNEIQRNVGDWSVFLASSRVKGKAEWLSIHSWVARFLFDNKNVEYFYDGMWLFYWCKWRIKSMIVHFHDKTFVLCSGWVYTLLNNYSVFLEFSARGKVAEKIASKLDPFFYSKPGFEILKMNVKHFLASYSLLQVPIIIMFIFISVFVCIWRTGMYVWVRLLPKGKTFLGAPITGSHLGTCQARSEMH